MDIHKDDFKLKRIHCPTCGMLTSKVALSRHIKSRYCKEIANVSKDLWKQLDISEPEIVNVKRKVIINQVKQ